MDEKVINQEEISLKHSRSSGEINAEKDGSSSADSGKQSSLEKQEEEQQEMACSSSNASDNGNCIKRHVTSNSDSGLGFKMEDSSCGDINVMGIAESEIAGSNKPENDADQQMSSNEMQKEEEPTTSESLIKRHRRNRSRNYRVAGRSSSSSSNSSCENHGLTLPEEPIQPDSIVENNATEDPLPISPIASLSEELPLPPSPNAFSSNFLDSTSSSSSSDSSSDSNDDDIDFEPLLFGGRLSPDFTSHDSNRVKEKDEEIDKVLKKQKPPYAWCGSYELMRREHGLSSDRRTSLQNGFSYGFTTRFYGSRHIVERMKISHALRKHSGCVNCVNFNKSGDLLVTGSDDARLIIWDWAGNKTKHVWKSGHSANIFQSKFLPSSSCIDIISAGRDGKVKRSIIPPSGGRIQVSQVYSHYGAVHKLVICPDNPSEIISVGEDGNICSKDLREDKPKVDMLKVFTTSKKSRRVRLFSISHHPFAPEICVSGSDQYVRVYDKRSMLEPIHRMSPDHIFEAHSPNVTCCVYNNTGTEILATYSEDNIYLFNNKNYVQGEYLHSYKGHFNQKTIKGVNFFGPNCEYVISGSDCGNIFYWDKNSEAILNFMPGDTVGVVNCLEPHPNTPILATSGLDHNIKIWTPSAEKHPPDLTKLTNCVRRNMRRTALSNSIDCDERDMPFFIRNILCRHRGIPHPRTRSPTDDISLDSDEDDDNDSDNSSMPDLHTENADSDDDQNLHTLSCGTQ